MRVRALWVSGLKITAGEQTMAGLIGELIGQLLLFNIILQHSLWVENTVDFFFCFLVLYSCLVGMKILPCNNASFVTELFSIFFQN